MNTTQLFEHLINGNHLSATQMQNTIENCMNGTFTDAQIASFLALMRMKGETVAELTSAATTMQQFAHHVSLGDGLVDIVGTGGDGKNTFNVSTISSFVVAAAGVRVAKHGNHSVSSRSGSADLLLQADFKLDLSDSLLNQCMNQCGIAFLFAPHFHQAMRHARNARQQLGIRTLFNLLGPLLNPANARKQVVGVYTSRWLKPIADVLVNLGSEHALVINSRDGMDEISIAALTDVVEYRVGEFKNWTIDPQNFGCRHANLDDIVVQTPAESLALAESVFAGNKGPARDMILLNSAAAIYCADHASTFQDAIDKAAAAIDSGLAGLKFLQLKALTQQDEDKVHA